MPYGLRYWLSDARIAAIASTKRRRCGLECDIWFTESCEERRVRLGSEDMVDELKRLKRSHGERMVE